MKLLLSTLNSKFIHSCLSVRYLKGYSESIIDTVVEEFTINQHIDFIVSEIYKLDPDIVGFSTYIWNREEILEISEILKMIKPEIKILLGGPEVSFDGEAQMKRYPFIDYIIYGEGEETFGEFIHSFVAGESMEGIRGLIYREGEAIIKNPERPLIADLNTIPSPYNQEVLGELENRIIYYESSRGCPFGCKFCLSSTIKGVRYFDIERVKSELGLLIDARVRQVKFVDRTFNANKQYAMDIMNFIMDKNPQDINFHFEVTAHLLDEEMLDFLSQVPEGMFQFEVGVQSTNPRVIDAVGRTTDFPKLREVTKRIKSFNRIHQHLDLIAGLPYEDYQSFARSFDQVYEIRPEKIQLGFLKLLKGSELRRDQDKYGFKYLDKAPYEVIENDFMDYKHIRRLKAIEEMVEIYYNEERFKHSLEFITRNFYESAFKFFEELAIFFEEKNYHIVSHGRRKLYTILVEFYHHRGLGHEDIFNEVIRLDFIENNQGQKLPSKIENQGRGLAREDLHRLLKDERLLEGPLVEYRERPTKDLLKYVKIENYQLDILELIREDYRIKDLDQDSYYLTLYRDSLVERARTIDITSIVKEMVE